MSINLENIATLNIHCVDYCCIINVISKSDAVSLLQNADLTEERGVLQNKLEKKLLPHIKWVKKL